MGKLSNVLTVVLCAVGLVAFSASTCNPPAKVEPDPYRQDSVVVRVPDRDSEDPDDLSVEEDHRIVQNAVARAGISLSPGLDEDGHAIARAIIGPLKDIKTGDDANTGGVAAFDANLAYSPAGMTVTGMAAAEPFGYITTNLNASGGRRTFFNAFLATTEGPVPPLAVADLRLRLKGHRDAAYTATLNFVTIADPAGNHIRQEAPARLTLMRGDADNSGSVDIKDAMAIAQYLAGSREIGITKSTLNPVNAASVHHDGAAGDRIDITDTLYIAQTLAGVRDAAYNRLPQYR